MPKAKFNVAFVELPTFDTVALAEDPADKVETETEPIDSCPEAPVLPVFPVEPTFPRGIVKAKTPELEVYEAEAELPASPVETETDEIAGAITVGSPFESKAKALDDLVAFAGNVISILVGSNTGALMDLSVSSETC